MRDGPNRVSIKALPFHQSLPLAAALFGFWIVLSGKLDAFHLGAGVVASLGVAAYSNRLFALPPSIASAGRHPFLDIPWGRLLVYLPWLFVQIAASALQVAAIVLRPRMHLDPQLFRFRHPLPHNLARAILANSITLTPGTVTLDVREDEYLVHALSADAATSLKGEESGNMKDRVTRLFGAVSS